MSGRSAQLLQLAWLAEQIAAPKGWIAGDEGVEGLSPVAGDGGR